MFDDSAVGFGGALDLEDSFDSALALGVGHAFEDDDWASCRLSAASFFLAGADDVHNFEDDAGVSCCVSAAFF